MSKFFWVILGVVVAALIGIFLISNRSQPQAPQDQNPQEITAADHVKGSPDAKVTFIEYGDFQCPACKAAEPLMQQLVQEYGDRVRFVFRHFPLTNIHPNAFAGARAAEAAASQGKFFEMHDLLYDKQDEWAPSPQAQKFLRDYAQQLGLDVDRFNDDYNSGSVSDRINRDVKIAQQLDVTATPTFFLNGQKLEPNPRSYQELKAKIDAELAKNP